MTNLKAPTILVILDGYGLSSPSKYNAVSLAKKPTLDRLFEIYPHTQLGATGREVGLEDTKMSGSEAGHMNIGAGRIATQDSAFITKNIKNGNFFMNPALAGAINHIKKYGSNLHLMGLMGDEDSPHSDPDHFRAILKLAKQHRVSQVYCHLFTDGRDSFPRSALDHLKNFKKMIKEEAIGEIATLAGRSYAMDRTKNWKRLGLAYDAIVFSRGEKADSPEEAIAKAYRNNLTDEYLLPTVIFKEGKPIAKLNKNDAIIFYNLRSDRARQFTKLFVAMNKKSIIADDMPPLDKIGNLYFVAMTDFGPDLDVHTVFKSSPLETTLPMVLNQREQLYIAESEKYAHVTYFLNGGYADPVNGENRIMIPSPSVENYAQTPQMSAELITDNVLRYIDKNVYDFITINYANADMVGHTGNLGATVKAIECLDKQVKKLVKETLKRDGNVLICADHGNAECMFSEEANQPNTFHTKNPVPFLLVSDRLKKNKLSNGGVLGNIAPTLLSVLGMEKPRAMNKESLLCY